MSEHTTVRVPKTTRDTLRKLAAEQGRTIQAVLEEAIEAYRRQAFFARLNRELASVETPDVREPDDEQALWDQTLGDGLAAEERWLFDGESAWPVKPR